MSVSEDTMRAHWGLTAFFFGVGAILSAVVLISGLMAPEPEQSVGTIIGEIARDIRNAATGVSVEEAFDADIKSFDLQAALMIVTPILGAIAAVLGGISLFRHEPTTLPKLAIGMGVSAFVMQYVFWLAVVICGTILLMSIVSNMDGILGE